jgi:hypothetical protein
MNLSIGVQLSPLLLATWTAATAERSLAAEGSGRELASAPAQLGRRWPIAQWNPDGYGYDGVMRVLVKTMRHCACREIRRRFRCPT